MKDRRYLRELNPTDDGEGEVAVENGHKAGDSKEEQHGGGADAGGGDLVHRQIGGLRDGGGGDGFHGLDGHRGAEEDAGGDVVEGGEDEGGGEVEIDDQRQRKNYRDVGAQVAHGAAQLGEEGGLQAERGGDAAAPPVEDRVRGFW